MSTQIAIHWFQAGDQGAMIVSEFSSTSRDDIDAFTGFQN
jgi:D-lyxose ketol-isomerase